MIAESDLVTAILNCDDERSAEFLISIIGQWQQNPLFTPSAKQQAWLDRIMDEDIGFDPAGPDMFDGPDWT